MATISYWIAASGLLGWASSSAAELDKFFSPDCYFSGTFTQTRALPQLPDPLTTEGQFFFHCTSGVLWQTQSPVEETLLLTLAGEQFFGGGSGQLTPLKGKVARQISELILTFISGDQDTITEFFDITSLDANSAKLTPRKRRLKRAINTVSLTVLESTSVTQEEQTATTPGLALEILAKDGSSIIINSWSNATFNHELDLLDHCLELNKSREHFCEALTPKAAAQVQPDIQKPSGP